MFLNIFFILLLIFFSITSFFIVLIIFDSIFDIIYKIIKKPTVPFISSPLYTLPLIFKALKLNKKSVFYDLGCGSGRVLDYLSAVFPDAKFIGVENRLFPFYFCLFKKIIKRKKFLILNKDFLNLNLKDATHIFIYLHPDVLSSFSSFINKKISSGVRLVSLDYPLPNYKPIETIKLKNNYFKLENKLFVYIF